MLVEKSGGGGDEDWKQTWRARWWSWCDEIDPRCHGVGRSRNEVDIGWEVRLWWGQTYIPT